MKKIPLLLLISLLIALPLAACVAWFSPGGFWPGFLEAGGLLFSAVFCLALAWRWSGAEKITAALIAVTFLLRLGLGMAASLALPTAGYDEPTQKAGYLFYDSYRRDQDAWRMAVSNKPLADSFGEEVVTDQYGGLLAISAGVYRYISPDAHRPFLILILGAFTAALGIPFFYSGVRRRWNRSLALAAAWILALYPDGLLFSASQLREPFLIGLGCIAFWAVLEWTRPLRENRTVSPSMDESERATRGWAVLACLLSLGLMALFSSRAAIAVVGILAVWMLLEILPGIHKRGLRMGVLALLAVGLITIAGLSVVWLKTSATWDLTVAERASGWVQQIITSLPSWMSTPFLVGYGLAQPVLPAAIADPSLPIWQGIAIFRGLGWYALAPLLVYGFYAVFKVKPSSERSLFLWLGAFILAWILISSLRAGGDQWDNPRYRTIFLPWMALLAAWAWQWARKNKDAWLWRILAIEGIFLAVFTNWYMARYYHIGIKMGFEWLTLLIAVPALLVIAGGIAWDKLRERK